MTGNTYNTSYIYASSILLLVIMALFTANYRKVKMPRQGKLFLAICSLQMMSNVFDILMYSDLLLKSANPQLAIKIDTTLYFIVHNLEPYVYYLYARTYTQGLSHSRHNRILLIPLIISLLCIVITPFTGFVFNVDVNGVYSRNIGMYFLYASSAIFFALSFNILRRTKNILRNGLRIALQYEFIIIGMLSILVQAMFYSLLIEGFGIALTMLIIYLSVESPEKVIDSNTGAFQSQVFFRDVALTMVNKKEFTVLTVTMNSQELLIKTFGSELINELRYNVMQSLKRICKQEIIVYHLTDSSFCIAFLTNDEEKIKEDITKVLERLDSLFKVKMIETYVETICCLFKCPEYASNADDILRCVAYIEKGNVSYTSGLVYANQLEWHLERENIQIRDAIQLALREGGFEVYYQPIFSQKSKRVESAEALLRLKDPALGNIPPDRFIPIAEQDGSIIEIGNYVIEEVCRFISSENIEKYGIKYIEINLSAVQCMSGELVPTVLNCLDKYNIKREMINLEITETAAVKSTKMFTRTIERLANEKITFSLDDYGTGYSTIDYIVSHPFKLIKIDKSIISSATESEKARIALDSTVAMLQRLNLEIVAEGVETEEQVKYLSELGVTHLQGFYFSKPVPPQMFLESLKMNCGNI